MPAATVAALPAQRFTLLARPRHTLALSCCTRSKGIAARTQALLPTTGVRGASGVGLSVMLRQETPGANRSRQRRAAQCQIGCVPSGVLGTVQAQALSLPAFHTCVLHPSSLPTCFAEASPEHAYSLKHGVDVNVIEESAGMRGPPCSPNEPLCQLCRARDAGAKAKHSARHSSYGMPPAANLLAVTLPGGIDMEVTEPNVQGQRNAYPPRGRRPRLRIGECAPSTRPPQARRELGDNGDPAFQVLQALCNHADLYSKCVVHLLKDGMAVQRLQGRERLREEKKHAAGARTLQRQGEDSCEFLVTARDLSGIYPGRPVSGYCMAFSAGQSETTMAQCKLGPGRGEGWHSSRLVGVKQCQGIQRIQNSGVSNLRVRHGRESVQKQVLLG